MTPLDLLNLAPLARLIRDTEFDEIDCEEMLHRLPAFLNARPAGAARSEWLRQVSQHLSICPECREELDALIRAEGLNPDELRQR